MTSHSDSQKIRVSTTVDDFTLPDVHGDSHSLYEILEHQPVILIFYRGGWCPLCNRQLGKISDAYEAFKARNVQVLAISNERAEKGEKVLKKVGPPYPLLVDEDAVVLEQFDLIVDRRDLLGFALRKSDYAHPAALLIGQDHRIHWSYRGKNYRDRPTVDQLLEAASQLTD